MPLVGHEPLADLVPAPVGHDHADDHRHRHPEPEDRLADDVRHLVERAPEDVAERAEERRPQPAADDAVRDEAPVGQPRGAGDERRERPHQSDEAADQDRLAAVALEVGLDLLEPLLRDLEARPVALEEAAPEPAADVEAGGVAEDGAGPDQPDQREQLDLALPCDNAGRDHDRLAGRHQPDERSRLQEGSHAHQRVGPRTQRLCDVLDHHLGVGKLREDAAGVHAEGERDRHAERLALEAQPAPAPRRRTPPPARRPPRRSSPGPTSSRRVRQRSSVTSAPSIDAAASSAARLSSKSPKQVGPEPLTAAPSAPGGAEAVEPGRQLGAQRQGRLLEVVLESGGQLGRPGRGEPAERLGVEAVACGSHPVELRVDRGGREPLRIRDQHGDERRGAPAAPLARRRPARARGAGRSGSARRSRGRRRAGSAPRAPSGAPASSLAIRSAAAASALPPPRPAATGMRLSIRSASGGRSPPARERNSASARAARLSPGTPGLRRCHRRTRAAVAVSSSARSIEAISEQIGCNPSSRGRPTCRTRLSFA